MLIMSIIFLVISIPFLYQTILGAGRPVMVTFNLMLSPALTVKPSKYSGPNSIFGEAGLKNTKRVLVRVQSFFLLSLKGKFQVSIASSTLNTSSLDTMLLLSLIVKWLLSSNTAKVKKDYSGLCAVTSKESQFSVISANFSI